MRIIRDCEFIRGEVPMTKEDIRTLTMAKLNVKEKGRYLDLGAGTGSVAINIALNTPFGKVTAVEKEEKGIELIKKNIEKFEVANTDVIHGRALEAVREMKGEFDGIFVGGSGGELEEIIEESFRLLRDGGKLVLNFITMKNVMWALEKLDDLQMEYNCVQIGVSSVKGKSRMIIANNPIFIIDVEKKK